MRIVLYTDNESRAIEAATEAYSKIANFEDIFSSYRAHSELRRLSQQPEHTPISVSAPLYHVLKASLLLSEETGGMFDITLGPLISLWHETRDNKQLPSQESIEQALHQTGWRHIQLSDSARMVSLSRSPLSLNMGGIAKGYILDEALKTLTDHGVSRAFLEAGGDIVVGDAPPK